MSEIIAGKRPRALVNVASKDIRQPAVKLSRESGTQNNLWSRRELIIRVEVTDAIKDEQARTASGARDVRLFRNSALVKVWHGDVLRGKRSTTLEVTVPVTEGENRFTAYAFNHDNVKSADTKLDITGDSSLRRPSTAYILAIGINAYANSQYNLKYAVAMPVNLPWR